MVCSVLIISGCDNIFQSKPEDVLSEYLQADLVGDNKKAYSYVSAKDKKNKSLEQYISEKSKHSDSELAKLFIDKTTHKIINVDISGNTANIKVDTITVDLEIITREFANAALKAATTGKSFEDIEKDIVEKYKKQDLPLNTYKSNHKLIKEGNHWKVVLNL
jgi:hypothetical protein